MNLNNSSMLVERKARDDAFGLFEGRAKSLLLAAFSAAPVVSANIEYEPVVHSGDVSPDTTDLDPIQEQPTPIQSYNDVLPTAAPRSALPTFALFSGATLGVIAIVFGAAAIVKRHKNKNKSFEVDARATVEENSNTSAANYSSVDAEGSQGTDTSQKDPSNLNEGRISSFVGTASGESTTARQTSTSVMEKLCASLPFALGLFAGLAALTFGSEVCNLKNKASEVPEPATVPEPADTDAFRSFDIDKSGGIDYAEFTDGMRGNWYPATVREYEEWIEIVKAADLNGDGEIDFDEFVQGEFVQEDAPKPVGKVTSEETFDDTIKSSSKPGFKKSADIDAVFGPFGLPPGTCVSDDQCEGFCDTTKGSSHYNMPRGTCEPCHEDRDCSNYHSFLYGRDFNNRKCTQGKCDAGWLGKEIEDCKPQFSYEDGVKRLEDDDTYWCKKAEKFLQIYGFPKELIGKYGKKHRGALRKVVRDFAAQLQKDNRDNNQATDQQKAENRNRFYDLSNLAEYLNFWNDHHDHDKHRDYSWAESN